MRMVLAATALIVAMQAASARDVADTFIDGLKICADVAGGEDLADIAIDAGFSKTPLLANSFQKDGVRIFQLERINQCHVQTANRPAGLSRFHSNLDAMAQDKPGQLRRMSWGEQRRRPILNDTYRLWNWEESDASGVIGFEVRELPGATANRPGEQALTATVSFTNGAKFSAPPLAQSGPAGEFDKIIVAAVDICARMMLLEPYTQGVASAGFKIEDRKFRRRVGEKYVTIERSGASPCDVYANGRPDNPKAVESKIRDIVTAQPLGFAVKHANRLESIPELGPEYDRHITTYARVDGREAAMIRLQRNKAAEVERPVDNYSYVVNVDRFLSRSLNIGPNGPLYVAILEAMTACESIAAPSGIAPAASKLGHVANEVGDLMRRVLDKGQVKIGWDNSNKRCSLSVYATPDDDANVFAAAHDWLKSENSSVTRMQSLVPKAESGISWKASVFRGQAGGRMRDVKVNFYETAQYPSATGPRFLIWIEPSKF